MTDISLGLDDLLTKRHAALVSTHAGKGQEQVLTAQRNDIAALPETSPRGRAFTEEIASADEDHDGFGYALWHLTEAILRAPNSTPEMRQAAQHVRDAFIPATTALQASYADEAAAARSRKGKLVDVKADLEALPIPGGGTAYDWAVAFLAAGEKLSELLSNRADAEAVTRKNAQLLRSETIGILNDLRRAIAREKRRNPSLPDDIDAQIFGYLDDLEERVGLLVLRRVVGREREELAHAQVDAPLARTDIADAREELVEVVDLTRTRRVLQCGVHA